MTEPIFPCIWFDGVAHEAAEYYCSIFPNSEIVSRNPMVTIFNLNGQKYMALNGGPEYSFTEAISLTITCKNQEEINYYWDALSAKGKEGKCGWLKDRFGLSWQVVPQILGSLMNNPEKAPRVMYSFMQMKKLDIAKLEAAAL
jgi:predicted 3-demethylubiquinone-9 3-methyltransferase (glyoxalase superfamily)